MIAEIPWTNCTNIWIANCRSKSLSEVQQHLDDCPPCRDRFHFEENVSARCATMLPRRIRSAVAGREGPQDLQSIGQTTSPDQIFLKTWNLERDRWAPKVVLIDLLVHLGGAFDVAFFQPHQNG